MKYEHEHDDGDDEHNVPGVAGVLVKLSFSGENDESHFSIAKH